MALQIFDLLKCECCGIPWEEHTFECANDRFKYDRMISLLEEREKPSWPRTEHLLRLNGWTPTSYRNGPNGPT